MFPGSVPYNLTFSQEAIRLIKELNADMLETDIKSALTAVFDMI